MVPACRSKFVIIYKRAKTIILGGERKKKGAPVFWEIISFIYKLKIKIKINILIYKNILNIILF